MVGVLRWLRRAGLTVLGLALLGLAGALITAHTAWGRDFLRRRIEAALGDAFPGGARVRALGGSVLGTLTLEGVELDGRDRRPMVTAARVELAVALWPLMLQTARIDRAVADDVAVFVRDQPPAAGPGAPPGAPSAWQVELPRLEVHRAVIEIDRARIALGDLDVAAELTVERGRVALSGAVRGRWSRAGGAPAALTASGSAVLDGGVRIPGAIVTLDGATIIATALAIDVDHPRGSITAVVPAATLAVQAPELAAAGLGAEPRAPGHPGSTLVATIDLAPAGDATRIAVTASVGDARLTAALHGELARRRVRGLVSASAVDLAMVTRGAIGGRGHLLAAIDASPDRVRGAAVVRGELAIGGAPLRRGAAVVAGGLDGATALAIGSGDDDLRVAAIAAARFTGGAVVIERASAAALSRGAALPCDAPAPCRRVTGELAARAEATGSLAPRLELDVTGEVTGARVAIAAGPGGAGRVAIGELRAPVHVCITQRSGGAAMRCDEPKARAVGSRPSGPSGSVATIGVAGAQGIAVALAGRVDARAVAYDDISVATARGSFALDVVAGALDAHGGALPAEVAIDGARVDATGIRRAGRLLGDGRVELARRGAAYAIAATARPPIDGLEARVRATARRSAVGYDAVLGETTVRLPDGAVWRAQGGSLAIPDAASAAIQLANLTLRSQDASLALSGRFVRGTGELAAHAGAERIDASSIASSIGAPPAVRGVGRATIDLARRGGRWQADADLAIDGFAVAAGAAPVDASAHLALAGGRATVEARAAGPALGELGVELAAATPADPFDVDGWRALDRDAIHTAAIAARKLALPGLAALFGRTGAAPAGTIDGAIDLVPAAPHGELAVRGVGSPIGALDADVAIAPRDGDVEASIAARLVDVAAAAATVRVAVPRHPFDPASWAAAAAAVAAPGFAAATPPAPWLARVRSLLRGAEARLDRVAFDPVLLARLGLADLAGRLPLRGRASAQLTVGAGATEARLAIDLDDVIGGPLVAPVAQRIELTAGAAGTHLRADLLGGGGGDAPGLGVVEADVAMTLDRWIDDPVSVVTTRFTAGWALPPTPLAPLLARIGRRELAGGTIEGSAMARGTVGAPVVPAAQLIVRDAQVAPRLGGRPAPAVRELALGGTWRGSSGTLRVDATEATGGELHAVVTGSPAAPSLLTGTARLVRLDLAPIAALLPGALASLAGEADGDLALRSGAKLTGKLRLARAALPLAPAIGTLRDASAEIASDAGKVTARLDGRLGSGAIHVTADASADDLRRATVRLRLDGVSPIAALRPMITAEITAQLERSDDQLRGDVTIERGSIALTGRTGTPLLATSIPSDLHLPGASPAVAGAVASGAAATTRPRAPARPWLVLDVRPAEIDLDAREIGEGIGVIGALSTGPLRVSLGDAVGIIGRVHIASDGVEILSRRYVVEPTPRGPSGVEFDGTTDPHVDLRLSYQFPALTLNVNVFGRLSKLDPLSFSSDPAGYSQDQLFGFFLGGEPSTDASSQTRDQAREAVTGAGTRVLSGALGRRLTRFLPVKLDALSCEPDPTATTTTSGSCTAGKWLSQRMYVGYRLRLQPRPDENTGDVQLQIRMGGRVLIQATGGDHGVLGADLLWRQRW